jgi:carbamate kinase
MRKIVIALGGNALQSKGSEPTAEAQLTVLKSTCERLAEISAKGYEMAIVHGNGPQVGQILLSYETSKEVVPPMPFDVCGAMSQGYIGYHIQQALRYALAKRNLSIPVVSLITQTVVERTDPAFQNPSKPIGPFYSKETADKLAQEKGYTMKEDAGRGYRRVVPSPLPRRIVEISDVKHLWNQSIVVTCGGGGIPVAENPDGTLSGVAAVIDKDFAAELLAEQVDADLLMILTEVEKVSLHWGKPDQREIDHLSLSDAARFVEEGHFAAGSMLPKVQACMHFVRSDPSKKAVITSLNKAMDALEGKTGTVVTFA